MVVMVVVEYLVPQGVVVQAGLMVRQVLTERQEQVDIVDILVNPLLVHQVKLVTETLFALALVE